MPYARNDNEYRTLRRDVDKLGVTVDEHETMLKGSDGLDRLVRGFLATQLGRDEEIKKAGNRNTWIIGLLISMLVGILEWHPWK